MKSMKPKSSRSLVVCRETIRLLSGSDLEVVNAGQCCTGSAGSMTQAQKETGKTTKTGC
jgi:hypothetical protein